MPTEREKLPYVPALDGLRAVAAVAVVGFHTRLPGFGGGFIGVEVFFVLSGFLITSILLREVRGSGRIRYGAFWMRRMVRLYPELLVVLAVYAIASMVIFRGRPVGAEVAAAALYVSNLVFSMSQMTFTRHMWSLAIEMQFYLAWPVVVLLLSRRRRGFAIGCLVAMFIVATAWRAGAAVFIDSDFAYRNTTTRLAGLVLGSLLAFGGWSLGARAANVAASAGAFALAMVVAFFPLLDARVGTWPSLIVDVAAAVLVVALVSRETAIGHMLSRRAIVTLGVWSYGIYLWHYPIAALARPRLPYIVAFAVTILASTALAAASFYFIARPVKRLTVRRSAVSRQNYALYR